MLGSGTGFAALIATTIPERGNCLKLANTCRGCLCSFKVKKVGFIKTA